MWSSGNQRLRRTLIRKPRRYENRVIFGRRCTFRVGTCLAEKGIWCHSCSGTGSERTVWFRSTSICHSARKVSFYFQCERFCDPPQLICKKATRTLGDYCFKTTSIQRIDVKTVTPASAYCQRNNEEPFGVLVDSLGHCICLLTKPKKQTKQTRPGKLLNYLRASPFHIIRASPFTWNYWTWELPSLCVGKDHVNLVYPVRKNSVMVATSPITLTSDLRPLIFFFLSAGNPEPVNGYIKSQGTNVPH